MNSDGALETKSGNQCFQTQRRSSETGRRNFRSKRFSRHLQERDPSQKRQQQQQQQQQQHYQQIEELQQQEQSSRRKTTSLKGVYKLGNSESSSSEDSAMQPGAKMEVERLGETGSHLAR